MGKFAVRAGSASNVSGSVSMPRPGDYYDIFIPGEPVPKSTQAPPKQKSKAAQYAIVMNPKYRNFTPLRRTWEYQSLVKSHVEAAVMAREFPRFHKDDPVEVGMRFYLEKHGGGDLKNHEAAIEDAMKMAGVYDDDRQIRGRLFSEILYYSEDPGVLISIGISHRVYDDVWLLNHFKRVQKHFQEYKQRNGIWTGI